MDNERGDCPSASEMPRIRRCPGAFNARRALPRRESGKDAATGIERHSLIEIDADTDTIDDQNTAYTVGRAKELLEEAQIAAGINGCETRVVREQRYWLYDDDLQRVVSARVDYLEIEPITGKALLVDYKTLFGDHGEAVSNEQLFTQAACADELEKFSEVYVALIQPNLERERQLTMAHMTRQTLTRVRGEVIGWSKAAMHPDAPRIPGPVQCKNCPAAGVACPESNAAALALSAAQKVELMEPSMLVRYLDALPQVEAVVKAIKDRAKDLLVADENSLEGAYVLKPGNRKCNITDIGKTAAILAEVGVSMADFQATLKASITDVTKLYAAAKGIKAPAARKELEHALESAEAMTVSQNQPSITKGK